MALVSRLWQLRDERPFFVFTAVFTLMVLLAWPLIDWRLRLAGIAPQYRFWDFGVYGATVQRWLAGQSLYVPNNNGGYHGSFLYPPIVVLLFYPFDLLPLWLEPVAWEIVSIGLLWVGLQAVVSAVGYDLHVGERVILLGAMLGFQPLLFGVKMGQTPAFLTAILCFGFAAVMRNTRSPQKSANWIWNEMLPGIAVAVVGVVKLVYAPAGTLLLRNRYRFAWAVVSGLGLVGISLTVFGLDTHLAYLEVLQWGIEEGGQVRDPRLWMPGYYRPLYAIPAPTLIRIVAGGIIAVLVVLAAAPADREAFATGVAAIPLLAPQTYTYYLVTLLPAAIVLLSIELEQTDGYPVLVPLGILLAHTHSYGLLWLGRQIPNSFPPTPAYAPLMTTIQPGLWGNLILLFLATYRLAGRISIDHDLR